MYASLVGRDVEHETVPFMRASGVGMMVWSPLASGFLSGRNGVPDEGAADTSPWAQLTDPADTHTIPLSLDDTPPPFPHKPKPPGRREPVSAWTTAMLLIGIVALSLVGIGAAVRLLVK